MKQQRGEGGSKTKTNNEKGTRFLHNALKSREKKNYIKQTISKKREIKVNKFDFF